MAISNSFDVEMSGAQYLTEEQRILLSSMIDNLRKVLRNRIMNNSDSSSIDDMRDRIERLHRIQRQIIYNNKDRDILKFERSIYLQVEYGIYNSDGITKFKIDKI